MLKKIYTLALVATFAASAFAQTKGPKDILQQVTQFETSSYAQARASHDQNAYKKIQDQVVQMVKDALKDVDPTKVDPKDAYDWAKLYSMIDEHKTVCDLTHAYLTTNPDPEQAFQDQMLMMKSCNALGEADMLAKTATSVKPVTSDDNIDFAFQATDYVNTIAAKEGNAEGLKFLARIQREVKLPDPREAAKQRLEAEKKVPVGSMPATAISGAPKAPKSDDEKLKAYEIQARSMNQEVGFEFASEKAKLLQGEGKKDEAIAALQDFSNTRDLAKGVKDMADKSVMQMKLSDTPEVGLKADKTIGAFSSLADLKGKVVLLDFFAHWCGPCMASVPSMVSMYGELHPQGLEIVGVTQFYGFFGRDQKLPQDQEFSKLQGLITDKNMTWPIIVGPKDNSSAYGVWGIPETVLIDKQGMIRNIWVGYDPTQEEQIKQATEKLLKE